MTASTVNEEGEVVVECGLDAPAEKVWRALTVAELAADWLGAAPQTGDNATDTGDRLFEVVAAEPFTRVTYRWRDRGETPPTESYVTIELQPDGPASTRFRLTHSPPRVLASAAHANQPMALAA